MKTSQVDVDEVKKLLTEVRRAQSSLDAGVQGFSNAPSQMRTQTSFVMGRPQTWTYPQGTLFGNTSGGNACFSAHQGARSTMDGALKAFANTVNSDAERLESALALYQKTDAESADNLLEQNRNRLDLISTHLTTSAGQQPEQLNRLRGVAGDPSQGNTVVGGDFNAQSTGNSPSAQGIRNFEGQGFDVHAGDIHDGKGGTSEHYRPIDQVLPRGVGHSQATRWDRDESDHDGQVVDVTLPDW